MVEALRVAHAVVILVAVSTYTYYMFIGFHSQSFKYAKKSFESNIEKNAYMKRDYEKMLEEIRREEMLQKQAEELEDEAKHLREDVKNDKVAQMDLELKMLREQLAAKEKAEKVAQMELELKLLREQLAANTDDVRFVNQNMKKKVLKSNNRHDMKMKEKLDMKEQARRIKYQMDKLNIVPNGKAHISIDDIKISNKEGVHVPEDFLESIHGYTEEPQMELEDIMEDHRSVIESKLPEDIIEEYSETDGDYLTEEELLAEFHYVEEPEDYLEDYDYEPDTGELCEMEAKDSCG